MKCKLQMKAIKMKEEFGGGGVEFGLTECAFLPRDCDISMTLLKVILRQHYCIIMATTLEKIYSCIGCPES